MTIAHSTTFAFSFSTRLIAAFMVPAVARRSSTIKMFWFSLIASSCISNVFFPYSNSYSSLMVFPGSFPGFRMGTKLQPRL